MRRRFASAPPGAFAAASPTTPLPRLCGLSYSSAAQVPFASVAKHLSPAPPSLAPRSTTPDPRLQDVRGPCSSTGGCFALPGPSMKRKYLNSAYASSDARAVSRPPIPPEPTTAVMAPVRILQLTRALCLDAHRRPALPSSIRRWHKLRGSLVRRLLPLLSDDTTVPDRALPPARALFLPLRPSSTQEHRDGGPRGLWARRCTSPAMAPARVVPLRRAQVPAAM